MRKRHMIGLVVAVVAIFGCGHDKQVAVGSPQEEGTLKRDKRVATEVAATADAQLKSGESVAYDPQ